jgi:Mrp family chromosome partitioning ATPase
VTRDGATDRSAIEKASALLSKSGPAALGLVINQAGPPRIVPAQTAMGLAS